MQRNNIIKYKEYKKIIDKYKRAKEKDRQFVLELDNFGYYYSTDPSIGEIIKFKVHGINEEYITRLDGTTRIAMGKLIDAKMKGEDYTTSVMVLLIGAKYLADSIPRNKEINLLQYQVKDFKKNNK